MLMVNGGWTDDFQETAEERIGTDLVLVKSWIKY